MKPVTSTVTYLAPKWNFCNVDNLNQWQELSDKKCKFCVKTRSGYECLLYGTSLSSQDGLVNKVKACCRASAGFESTIDSTGSTPAPQIHPGELIDYAIDKYTTVVKQLVDQGYPRALAETVARKAVKESK